MDLPNKDTAETIEHLATAIGILLGGLWAFWKWSLSEFLRRRRESPAFYGKISGSSIFIGNNREVLTVVCEWENTSVVSLTVNTKETRFMVYEIPDDTLPGPIGPRLSNWPEKFVRRPLEHWPSTYFEAGTKSDLRAHFLFEVGRHYVIACRLEALTKPGEDKMVWVREFVWQSAHKAPLAGA